VIYLKHSLAASRFICFYRTFISFSKNRFPVIKDKAVIYLLLAPMLMNGFVERTQSRKIFHLFRLYKINKWEELLEDKIMEPEQRFWKLPCEAGGL